ncbi:hypothetical protein DVR01_10560 (plasmid) [Limosilactobacillus fermentum]|nr:hypothetical protein DVR01_10560 [Limosilactobacillus fermentum]
MEYEQILAILDEWIATYEQEFDYLWVQGRMKVLDKSIIKTAGKSWIKPLSRSRLLESAFSMISACYLVINGSQPH